MATSARSETSAKGRSLRRPFAGAILAEARQIAQRYKIVLELEDGVWFGSGLELPTVFGEGATADMAVKDTRHALEFAVAHMLEKGRRPPAPAAEELRSEQVNVRLSSRERSLLESRAKARGFRGLSDFIRTSVLARS